MLLMDLIDISDLRAWVERNLSKNDPVRVAVESQPNQVTRDELVVLLKSWDLMLAAAR